MKSISDGKDPEGPPYIQYEEVPPTRESNALIGSLLTVDENRHSLYIRTVSSYHMLSALLNWFKLVYELFGQSNMHRTLEFCPEQPVRNQMTTTQIQISHQN